LVLRGAALSEQAGLRSNNAHAFYRPMMNYRRSPRYIGIFLQSPMQPAPDQVSPEDAARLAALHRELFHPKPDAPAVIPPVLVGSHGRAKE
jgi:hypothetical protein